MHYSTYDPRLIGRMAAVITGRTTPGAMNGGTSSSTRCSKGASSGGSTEPQRCGLGVVRGMCINGVS